MHTSFRKSRLSGSSKAQIWLSIRDPKFMNRLQVDPLLEKESISVCIFVVKENFLKRHFS